jgi:copper chaperone NosL
MREPQLAARRSWVRSLITALVLSCLAMLAACSGEPDSGPVAVKWDRVTCERCRMVLSARHHSAQVRVRDPGGKSRAYFFDDIGCAVIWLEDNPWRDDRRTEIWVNDWRSGEWIDARSAYYLTGQETPMQYGLGAQTEPAVGALNYAAAKAHIFDVERRFNVHGGSLDTAADDHGHQ